MIKMNKNLYGLINHSSSLVPVHTMGHDVVEIVNSDESILIKISSVEHVLDFFIGEVFP